MKYTALRTQFGVWTNATSYENNFQTEVQTIVQES